MIVAIHQPQYLPWLGYFDKVLKTDTFCYLDNVQFKKNEWQNRNRIKTSQGWQWLTVPVEYRFPQKINEVTVNNTADWGKKHLQAMISNYGKAPFFEENIDFFRDAYGKTWTSLSDLNIHMTEYIRKKLGMGDKPTVLASQLKLSDDPTGRLIDICVTLGADTYLAGRDGAKYMDLEQFKVKGLKVITQDFQHPRYPQRFGAFESNLSVVDLLFNCGPQSSEKILGRNILETNQT
ncbi:MAG: WbqC family protein [Desulfobacterales bacterium]|nr:WbqC family protein [Desulfobacterales bacterium]